MPVWQVTGSGKCCMPDLITEKACICTFIVSYYHAEKNSFAIVLVTLALTLAVMVYFMYFVHPQPDMPAPTDRPLKQEEGAEHNDAREAWIEQMHRTAPGANWRQMDRELRLQLAASCSEQYALEAHVLMYGIPWPQDMP